MKHSFAKVAAIVTACVAALSLVSCSKKSEPTVLAVIGDHKITIEEFKKEVERRIQARRPVPNKETLLQEMVNNQAALQRARKAGVADDPQLQHEINNLIIAKAAERELTPRLQAVSVTQDEAMAEYQKNLAKYERPAKARLALLFLEANSKMSESTRAELRTRLAEARQKATEAVGRDAGRSVSAGFGPLAIDYSEEQTSRYRGGDIGWLEAGNYAYRWPRPVLEAGYALEKGVVSEVIEAVNGFYLVMKTDGREGSTIPFEQVQATLQQSLLVKKRREVEEAYRQETLRLVAPKIDTKALAQVELALPPVRTAQNHDPGSAGLMPGNNSAHGN